MFNSITVNEKFKQYRIIDHYKNTIKNDFSREVIGVDNMKKLENGLCCGLTHLFLRYAHANYEKTFITEFYREIKRAKNNKKLTNENTIFINKLFNAAAKIQLINDKIINIHNARCSFNYPPRFHDETTENYLTRLLQVNIIQSSSHQLTKQDALEFQNLTMQLYFYTYYPQLRDSLLHGKTPDQVKFIKDHARQVKQKCSNFHQNDLANNHIQQFMKLSEYFQTRLLQEQLKKKNNKYGIFYQSSRTENKISEYSHDKEMTLTQFKKTINLRLEKKQDTISDFSSRFHMMGIAIKHREGVPVFEIFDPNEGLVITTKKEKFFRVLDKLSKSYTCLKNKAGEKIVDANMSYTDKLYQHLLFDKIKEPKFYK